MTSLKGNGKFTDALTKLENPWGTGEVEGNTCQTKAQLTSRYCMGGLLLQNWMQNLSLSLALLPLLSLETSHSCCCLD